MARKKISGLLGKAAYEDGKLNRPYISEKVFKDKTILKELNKIVHPLVRKNFLSWAKKQEHPYVIQEAAIIFENQNQDFYDAIILVTAPQEVRMERIIKRDGSSREKILERMDNQWSDSQKIPLSNYVIENMEMGETRLAVERIHYFLLYNS